MHIRCLSKILTLALAITLAQLVHSDTPAHPKRIVRLATFHIPLMVEDANTGLFIELVRQIEKETQLTFEIEVWPTPRAIQHFNEKKYDVLFPGLDAQFKNLDATHPSRELLYVKRDYVFTLNERRKIKSIEGLTGLIVGLTRSYPYSRELLNHRGSEFIYVTSDEQNALMLARNRIDAFVVEESSGREAFTKTGLIHKVHYDKDYPISSQDVYFAFHRNNDGFGLEVQFSAALAKLKANGKFDEIMNGALSTGLEDTPAKTSPSK